MFLVTALVSFLRDLTAPQIPGSQSMCEKPGMFQPRGLKLTMKLDFCVNLSFLAT